MMTERPENVRTIHVDDLRVLLQEAAERGALKALEEIGLTMENREDLHAAIAMAQAVKIAKREALRELGRWLIRAVVVGSVVALAAKFGISLAVSK